MTMYSINTNTLKAIFNPVARKLLHQGWGINKQHRAIIKAIKFQTLTWGTCKFADVVPSPGSEEEDVEELTHLSASI